METQDDATMSKYYSIEPGNYTLAWEAAGQIKKILKQLGIDAALIRKVAIASYEAEMNLVIHSIGGRLILKVNPQEITIIAQDDGPGIKDIELAMQEGYSTAPDTARKLGFGAGMGLPNIKRYSDRFSIQSGEGEGTQVQMSFYLSNHK